jgi:cardiolipin synthase (CMP-forming)
MLHHLPNALCVLRILLAIPVAWLLSQGEYAATLWVFAFAAVTDALDGFLAKRFGWESELGKALDPLADKILLVTSFITLTIVSHVPLWLAIVVVVRDVIIGFGAVIYHFVFGPVNGRPTVISKLNTLFQIGYVIVVVGAQAAQQSLPVIIIVLTTLVLVTTIASGIDYVATYIQRAIEVSQKRTQRDGPQ